MGAAASVPKGRGGIVLSFDALGTLYRFREPFAQQYLNVARQCGLKAPVKIPDLESSFRSAFKSISSVHPNYGKGRLDSPEEWWTELVTTTFKDVVHDEELPQNLGASMYKHFSSSDAYELYPDVKPFLANMHRLRKEFSDEADPMIMLGIITNSDPRVSQVFSSMGLKIGTTKFPDMSLSKLMLELGQKAEGFRQTGLDSLETPWHSFWNVNNDFDFLMTSYQANSEKPDKGIFGSALNLATYMILSRAEQGKQSLPSTFTGRLRFGADMAAKAKKIQTMTWIHIGDEYIKDYKGAEEAGLEALHLVRAGERVAQKDAKTVTSLDEVAAIVNIMVAENFKQ